MKAKIKATGEIVHVGDYNTISHDPMYKNERTGPWRLEELDFAEAPDYWTRLEHQYAGMAMQGKSIEEIEKEAFNKGLEAGFAKVCDKLCELKCGYEYDLDTEPRIYERHVQLCAKISLIKYSGSVFPLS